MNELERSESDERRDILDDELEDNDDDDEEEDDDDDIDELRLADDFMESLV